MADNRKNGENRWSVSATTLFIRLYEKNRMLYDVTHRDYKSRSKRLEVYKEMSNILKDNGYSYTIEDVKRKLNGIRSQFLAEKIKISNSIKNGFEGDEMYTPAVYWYGMLHFLEPSTRKHEMASNVDEVDNSYQQADSYDELIDHTEVKNEELVISDESNNYLDFSESETTPKVERDKEKHPCKKVKTKKSSISDYELSKASRTLTDPPEFVKKNKVKTQNHTESNDSVNTFADFIADELKSIRNAGSDVILRQAKRKITQAIFQAWDTIDTDNTREFS